MTLKYIVVFNYFIFYLPFRISKLMKEDMGKTRNGEKFFDARDWFVLEEFEFA